MARVLRVALVARELDAERHADLQRIFGQEVMVDTISTPHASVIVDHAKATGVDAIVLEMASPDTVRDIQSALPETPILAVRRKEVEVQRELGVNERGQRVHGAHRESRFESYVRRNARGEVKQLANDELNPRRD